jgi:excisionase family DNA binding protein
MIEEYLTTEEVAKCLRIHKATVTRWLKEGKLKAMKKGRRWLISQSDYDKFVSSEEVK